jgi:hypothetical protein
MAGVIERTDGYTVRWSEKCLTCGDEDCNGSHSSWGFPGAQRLDQTAELGNPWKRFLEGAVIPCYKCGEPLVESVQEYQNRIPAVKVVECYCGERFEIQSYGGYDEECPRCAQPFNSFGQPLERDRRLWDGTDGATSPDYC